MDGLTLGVHERVAFRVGLFGVEPSESGTFVGRGVLDRDGDGFALLQRQGERDGQSGTEDWVLPFRRYREGEVFVTVGEGASLDSEVRSVEDDLVDIAAAGPEVQGGLSSDDALGPIYSPVEFQVGGFNLEVVGLGRLLLQCGDWVGWGQPAEGGEEFGAQEQVQLTSTGDGMAAMASMTLVRLSIRDLEQGRESERSKMMRDGVPTQTVTHSQSQSVQESTSEILICSN